MSGFQFDLRCLLLLVCCASACGASLLAGHYGVSGGFAIALGVLVFVAAVREAQREVSPEPGSGTPDSSRPGATGLSAILTRIDFDGQQPMNRRPFDR
ncbi:MAG: hypothetical protein WBC44_22180 [Planctomycetaceae bacterium]